MVYQIWHHVDHVCHVHYIESDSNLATRDIVVATFQALFSMSVILLILW